MPAYVAGTTPYAWPWNADLTGKYTALVVVAPRAAIPEADESACATVAASVYALASAVRESGGPVIRVTTAPPQHANAPAGSWFSSLAPDASTASAGIDGFFGSALEPILRERSVERILIVGAGLETTVHSTMRSANDRGYECLLVLDACVAYDESLIPSARSMIEMSGGIFGAVGSTADVLHALPLLPSHERISS